LQQIAMQALAEARGCHRVDHTDRVVANALRLAEAYPAADRDALEAAAWLHDIGRAREREAGRSHAVLSAEMAAEVLPALGFDTARTALICAAIADHRFSTGRVPASLEGCLLQDADRLDALGAIGIARTFAEGYDRELYHRDDPFAAARTPDDDHNTLDHFFVKLLRLPGTLHTPEARAEAARRLETMLAFLRALANELGVSPEACDAEFLGTFLAKDG
jgi:uncharacterized protein